MNYFLHSSFFGFETLCPLVLKILRNQWHQGAFWLPAPACLSMPGSSHFRSLQIQSKQLPGTLVEALTTLHVQDVNELLKKHGSATFCWLKVQLNLEKKQGSQPLDIYGCDSNPSFIWLLSFSLEHLVFFQLYTLLCAGRRRVYQKRYKTSLAPK